MLCPAKLASALGSAVRCPRSAWRRLGGADLRERDLPVKRCVEKSDRIQPGRPWFPCCRTVAPGNGICPLSASIVPETPCSSPPASSRAVREPRGGRGTRPGPEVVRRRRSCPLEASCHDHGNQAWRICYLPPSHCPYPLRLRMRPLRTPRGW